MAPKITKKRKGNVVKLKIRLVANLINLNVL